MCQANNTCIILIFAWFSVYYHNYLQFTAGKKHHTQLPNIEDVCNESSLFATCWNVRYLQLQSSFIQTHCLISVLNTQSVSFRFYCWFLNKSETPIISIHIEKISKDQVRFWLSFVYFIFSKFSNTSSWFLILPTIKFSNNFSPN